MIRMTSVSVAVKSAVLNYINGCKMKDIEIVPADIAASFQKAVTDVLIEHAMHASKNLRWINLRSRAVWLPM